MGELPQRHAARGMTMKALTLTGQKGDSFQDVQPVEHWLFFGGCLMIEGRLFHAWLNECLISCWPIVCSLGMARPHPVNFADAISWSFSLAVEWMVGSFGSLLASPNWYSWVCSHPQRTFRTSSSRIFQSHFCSVSGVYVCISHAWIFVCMRCRWHVCTQVTHSCALNSVTYTWNMQIHVWTPTHTPLPTKHGHASGTRAFHCENKTGWGLNKRRVDLGTVPALTVWNSMQPPKNRDATDVDRLGGNFIT